MRQDATPASRRLADNMLDYNPAATESLVQLMWGGLLPGREGGLVNARLRYFDPERRRAGLPQDVAALISQLTDTTTTLTLINLNPSALRTVIIQGGAYGEHRLTTVRQGSTTTPIDAPLVTVELEPGSGGTLQFEMNRYANDPTIKYPWKRSEW